MRRRDLEAARTSQSEEYSQVVVPREWAHVEPRLQGLRGPPALASPLGHSHPVPFLSTTVVVFVHNLS